MDKFKDKYRIPSNRLQGRDYGATGYYFVTVCTKDHKHYFGQITDDYPSATSAVETDNYPSLRKTKIGEMAEKFWTEIPHHFPFVILDRFVIMPNHIHGILLFSKDLASWQPNAFGRQSQNLGSVIRGFKSSIKHYANENNMDFAWQERFYDRIIRDDDELDKVRNYILNNPQNWMNDELNTVETDNYPSPQTPHTVETDDYPSPQTPHTVETDNYPSPQTPQPVQTDNHPSLQNGTHHESIHLPE